jgi:hypothetical protein
MCLGIIGVFWSDLLRGLEFPRCFVFPKLGKFSGIVQLNKFSMSFSFSSPSGILTMQVFA